VAQGRRLESTRAVHVFRFAPAAGESSIKPFIVVEDD
jgi:hypothetical protein